MGRGPGAGGLRRGLRRACDLRLVANGWMTTQVGEPPEARAADKTRADPQEGGHSASMAWHLPRACVYNP